MTGIISARLVQRLLAECGLPDSLEHGNFGLFNLALTKRGYLYFDWSDSSLAHPYSGLSPLPRPDNLS